MPVVHKPLFRREFRVAGRCLLTITVLLEASTSTFWFLANDELMSFLGYETSLRNALDAFVSNEWKRTWRDFTESTIYRDDDLVTWTDTQEFVSEQGLFELIVESTSKQRLFDVVMLNFLNK